MYKNYRKIIPQQSQQVGISRYLGIRSKEWLLLKKQDIKIIIYYNKILLFRITFQETVEYCNLLKFSLLFRRLIQNLLILVQYCCFSLLLLQMIFSEMKQCFTLEIK
ncbi:unnamed protein product [Paramecium sonneborni]|uniref:Transmembrane protein n=1 Tax=Paramecium sonneborni TaxID=65129 RepID=A0A8S1MV90_9CILI|nr:unnamed protein product [Paramecium sonneborni]